MEAAGTLFRVPSMPSDADSTRAWMRLVKAVAASFLLHVALLVGIPVNPTGGVPQMVSTLTARLEPAAPPSEAVPDSVALVPAAVLVKVRALFEMGFQRRGAEREWRGTQRKTEQHSSA